MFSLASVSLIRRWEVRTKTAVFLEVIVILILPWE